MEKQSSAKGSDSLGPLWEVFVQSSEGAPHEHAGSVHAADAELALQSARDVYTRRGKTKNIWVVPANLIVTTASEDAASFFDPSDDKIYRHPQFYRVDMKGFK